MNPLTYLHLQMRLESKEAVNEYSMRQVEAVPGEELPLMLVAQLSNAKLVVYYDQAISLEIQKELITSVTGLEFPKIDSLLHLLKRRHIAFELSSQSEQFKIVGNDLNSAERLLIQHGSPSFNVSQNRQPTPIPHSYLPPNARLRCSRSLTKLIHQAKRAVRAEDHQLWVQELE